jgi:hypothetical protein
MKIGESVITNFAILTKTPDSEVLPMRRSDVAINGFMSNVQLFAVR